MELFNKKNKFVSEVVILAVVFGFAAGVVGQIFSKAYIDPLIETPSYFEKPLNESYQESVPELKKVRKFLGTAQDFKINEIIESITPALGGVYLKISQKSVSQPFNQIYSDKNLLGASLVLTSDGWFITHQNIISDKNLEQLVIIIDQNIFPLKKIIIDPTTDIAFLKIEASNLTPVKLGDFKESILGQEVLALNYLGEVTVTNINSLNYQSQRVDGKFINSSEKFSKLILIKDSLASSYQGGPLVSLAGEIIGIISEFKVDKEKEIKVAVPTSYFEPIIFGVLKNNEIRRPYLGINYLDLAQVPNPKNLNLVENSDRGALVLGFSEKNSPAAQAGLKINDIILKVDKEDVSRFFDLTELIQEYPIGGKVELTILREGKEMILPVQLQELKK